MKGVRVEEHVNCRINTHEERINKMATDHADMKVIISKLDTIISQLSNQVLNQIEDHEGRLRTLEGDKAQKWEKVSMIVATAVITLTVGIMAVELGLK